MSAEVICTETIAQAVLPIPGVSWGNRDGPVTEWSGGMAGEEGGRETGGGRDRRGSAIAFWK